MLGNRADLGVMALGPDLERLDTFRRQLGPPCPRSSRRLVRLADRALRVHPHRRRGGARSLIEAGVTGDELTGRVQAFRRGWTSTARTGSTPGSRDAR